MNKVNDRELEVKLYLLHPEAFQQKVESSGASLFQARVHEWNLRFDAPDHSLSASGRVLRLRKDAITRLTFKSDASLSTEVADRQEIEVEVGDFDAMRRILELLGFTVYVMYEKFRTTWNWKGCEITMDEMPFGTFCEVEGPDTAAIMQVVHDLGLAWENRILTSYLGIFSMLRNIGFTNAENLVFSGFEPGGSPQKVFEKIDIHPADY